MAQDPRFHCKLTRKLVPMIAKKRIPSFHGPEVILSEDMQIVEAWWKERSGDEIIEEDEPMPLGELFQKAAQAKGKDNLNIIEMVHMERAYNRFLTNKLIEASRQCARSWEIEQE